MNIPRQLGPYTLKEPLNATGRSGLYRARADWDAAVLLDILYIPEALTPTGKRIGQHYWRGARSLLQVQHPQLPRALDIREDGEWIMLAFEDVLHKPLTISPHLPLLAAHLLAQQLFRALGALHAHALLHTRLTPRALWTNAAGEPIMQPPALGSAALADTVTAPASDPRYTPAEVQSGGAWSSQGDLYALAAVLWAGLSGQMLPTAAARDQGAALPPLPLPLQGSALEWALTHALRPDLSGRSVSVSEVLEQLGPAPQMVSSPVGAAAVRTDKSPAAEVVPNTEPVTASVAAPGSQGVVSKPAAPVPPSVPAARRPRWAAPAAMTAVLGSLALAGLNLRSASDLPPAGSAGQPAASLAATFPSPAGTAPALTPAAVPVPAPKPERKPLRTDVVISPQLNVRAEPGAAATILSTLEQGDRIEVFGGQGGWSEVRHDQGEMGWVKTELTLPLVAPEQTQAVLDALQVGQSVQLERGVYWLEQPLDLQSYQGEIRGVGARASVMMSRAPQDTVRFSGSDVKLTEMGIAHAGSVPARALSVSGGQLTLTRVRLSGAVRDQSLQEYGSGLWLTDGARANINKSSFEANAYGLYVADTSQAFVTASNLSRNAEGGALWHDQSGGELNTSAVTRNGAHGVHVAGSASPKLLGNEIRANKARGVMIYGAATPLLMTNKVTGNGLQGIGVQDQAAPEIQENTVQGNAQSGLAYFDSAGGVAQGNQISENGKAGVSLAEAAWPTLTANQISRNGTSGLAYADQSGGEAALNLIKGHPNPGISAWGDARPLLSNNTVTQGSQSGIVFAERAGGVVADNNVQNQALYGIIVTDEATPELMGNTVIGNRKGGLLFKRSAVVNAFGNVCKNNGGQNFGLELNPQAPQPTFDKAMCP